MDTWLIAQCMARLPPLTYFSHPESSLQDFFSSDRNSLRDERSRRRDAHSGQNGTVEHELRFLSSLRLSLGAAPHIPSADFVIDDDDPLSHPAVSHVNSRARITIPPRSRNVLGAPAVPAASTPAPSAWLHIAETRPQRTLSYYMQNLSSSARKAPLLPTGPISRAPPGYILPQAIGDHRILLLDPAGGRQTALRRAPASVEVDEGMDSKLATQLRRTPRYTT
ncbi:hypothetical protein HYDPIDRAFT_109982 [Hydnomerulius pinastri MD-312]|nr:hypothetical protein HYDPIDRAFT_109982 [Hydnomerulius pinastri MD-312]